MTEISKEDAAREGYSRYYTGDPCLHGHLGERFVSNDKCCVCRKKYNDDNKDKIKRYSTENKETIAIKAKEFRDNNKEHTTQKKKRYNANNKDKRKAYYEKIKNNPEMLERIKKYKLENRELVLMRTRRWREKNPMNMFTRRSLERIEKAKAKRRIVVAEYELGYTQEDFKKHIESLFKPGMTWDNRSEWHIDHIVPIVWWLKEGITDVSMINALINLQPLWASENMSKGSTI